MTWHTALHICSTLAWFSDMCWHKRPISMHVVTGPVALPVYYSGCHYSFFCFSCESHAMNPARAGWSTDPAAGTAGCQGWPQERGCKQVREKERFVIQFSEWLLILVIKCAVLSFNFSLTIVSLFVKYKRLLWEHNCYLDLCNHIQLSYCSIGVI